MTAFYWRPEDAQANVRQVIIFPTPAPHRRAGLVRDQVLLIETSRGTVFKLRLPYGWEMTQERLSALAEALGQYGGLRHEWREIASAIGWQFETRLDLLDSNLADASAAEWPVRAAALDRCMDGGAGDASKLAAQVDELTNAMTSELERALRDFAAALDPEIISLAGRWRAMPIGRYNYFGQVHGTRRRFRIQAAQVSPALLGVLTGEDRKPEHLEERLTRVIDVGEPLVEALADVCGVSSAVARHGLRMPVELLSGGRVFLLARALAKLAPESYPRTVAEWETLERLVRAVLPNLTGRPAGSAVNLSLLPGAARSGWEKAEARLAELGDDAPAQLRAFIDLVQRALSWYLQENDGWGALDAQQAASAATDEGLAAVGLLRMVQIVRAWPPLLRAAQAELEHRHSLLQGKRWIGVLDSPVALGGLVIEQLQTAEACQEAGDALSNCIANYATSCASDDGAHIFTIREPSGTWRGALHLTFQQTGRGGHRLSVRQLLGPRNHPIDGASEGAARAFCEWLRSSEGQERIAEMFRQRMLVRTALPADVRLRLELEPVVAALGKVSPKAMRFDALRETALRRLNPLRPDEDVHIASLSI